ncbi:MAG TPA: hypothetical protein PKC58_11090 [Ignavibacteria bacterium]|nr:hypothetical protein [Ignavibacteria bacterium]
MKTLKYLFIAISISMTLSANAQWTQAINIPGHFVKSLVKCGDKYFAGTSTGILNIGRIYSSTDNGQNWYLVNTGYDFSGVFSMAVRGDQIFAGTYEDGLLRSTDAGLTWTIDNIGENGLGVFGVAAPGDSNVFIYVNIGFPHRLSVNNGQSFTSLPMINQLSMLQTYTYAPGKFIAGSRYGVAVSENNGADWVSGAGTGLPENPDHTRPVRAVKYFNNKIFAGCINSMYVSSDMGNTFAPTNFLLSNSEYFSSMISVGNKLFASLTVTSSSVNPSVIMTTNEGINWINYQETGFAGNSVYSLVASDDYLIAGTSSSGIWIRPLEKQDLNLTVAFEGFSSRDTIDVEIRESVSPYSIVETRKGMGGSGVSNLFGFTNSVNATPYYITVRHRNSITTWSRIPVAFENNFMSYDFTGSASQAFGNNLVNVNSLWSIYTGDVNRDDVVDLSDVALISNDAANYITGYAVTDLNLDGIVDLGDLIFGVNNSSKFISEIHP